MKKKLFLLFFAVAILFFSCSKDDDPIKPYVPSVKGMFVLNEGTFMYANASLSYFDMETNTVENDVFFRVNEIPLGDVAQSLTKIGDDLYIVVNNSNYIYKVDAKSIEYKAKIEGFASPRYMLPIDDNKAYVSDLESPGLYVLNLNTMGNSFIETGSATEAMVKIGDEVFVSNWSNYYVAGSSNCTIQVIDCVNDTLVADIEVAPEPNAMVVDKNNHIWVSCSGGYEPPCAPAIICIDPATRTVIQRFDLPEGSYPDGMSIDGAGENLYFLNGGYNSLSVYKINVDDQQLPDTAFIASEGRWFYNLTVHPQNGDIYITEAKPTSNGNLLHYTSDGTLVGTYEVGMFPSYMLFN